MAREVREARERGRRRETGEGRVEVREGGQRHRTGEDKGRGVHGEEREAKTKGITRPGGGQGETGGGLEKVGGWRWGGRGETGAGSTGFDGDRMTEDSTRARPARREGGSRGEGGGDRYGNQSEEGEGP